MLLEHVKGTTVDTELEAEYTTLTEQMDALLNRMNVILEAPMGMMADRLAGEDSAADEMGMDKMPAPGQVGTGDNMEEIMVAMEQVMKQMEAAKRGLGFVNKLGDSPSRTTNKSRIMGNMNKIRGNLRRIEKMLDSGIPEKMDLESLNTLMDKKSKEGLKDPFGMKKKKSVKRKSK